MNTNDRDDRPPLRPPDHEYGHNRIALERMSARAHDLASPSNRQLRSSRTIALLSVRFQISRGGILPDLIVSHG